MKLRTAISIVAAATLALTSLSIYADQQGRGGSGADRTQQMDRDRDYDRDRVQDRTRLDIPDQDRIRDRDRLHDGTGDQDRDRDQVRDRIHLQDPASLKNEEIYGHELMSEEELNQYRKQLQNMNTIQEREKYQAQHEKMMRERAMKQGKDLVPPGQGPIYGGELMSVQERNEYREQLRMFDSDDERLKFMAQHKEKMNARAKALELEVEEAE